MFFYAPEIEINPELPADESTHIVRALRHSVGDILEITDGCGNLFRCQIDAISKNSCSVSIIEKIFRPFAMPEVQIAVAPTKNIDRIEWFIEKATEIGISQISLIECRRSERVKVNYERLRRLAISAMKQSQKTFLPVINPMMPSERFFAEANAQQKIIPHCGGTQRAMLPNLLKKERSTIIVIGPEGDFAPEEISLAEKNGFEAASFGSSILRTETAALFALSSFYFVNLAQ